MARVFSKRRHLARRARVGVAVLALVACNIDAHELAPAAPPALGVVNESGGAPGTDDGSGDMGSGGDVGGAAVTGEETGGQAGGVVDVPLPTTADTSWTFDTDAALGDFRAEDGAEQSFGDADADGSAYSGSLVVTNESTGKSGDFTSLGSSVCVPVVGGTTYDIAVAVEIDPGQSSGSGGFDVEFLDGDACDGGLLDLSDYLTATSGSWQLGEKTPTAPDGARTALVRLVASKRKSDPAFAVHFDDVRFVAQ